MYIILLRGYSQSGKDYVGNILCNEYGFTRFAFADSLKSIISKVYKCPIEYLHSQEGKSRICETDSKKRTYRQILIEDALKLRKSEPGIFAKYCSLEIIKKGANNIVITDWRYENELDILKFDFPSATIIPVHIIRNNQEKSPVDDISEYQLNNRTNDYTIINDMSPNIHNKIKELINNFNINKNK
jgi:hypothetical protein